MALLRKSLTKHDSGVYLLPRPVQIEDSLEITAESFQKALGLLRASFTHLVIDLSKSYNALDLAALNVSEHILLLTQLDLPCLRNVVRLLASLEAQDEMKDRVRVVVNRSGLDNTQISAKTAEETIAREIFWRVPNNYAIVSDCRNNGVPLIKSAPKAAITHSIAELAGKLSGNEVAAGETQKEKKKNWIPFLNN